MKRYLVLLAHVAGEGEGASPEEQWRHVDAHAAFEAYLARHGRRLSSAALADADTATTVRHRDGGTVVTDGPLVESAEVLGGYYDVELPDLDHAIAAAALLPPAYAVEIRPAVQVEGHERA